MKKIAIVLVSTILLLITWVLNRPSEYENRMSEVLLIKSQSKETNFDGFEEPAMPNQIENDKTLLGVDTNKNNLRDDVEIWINRFGKNYNERMALRQTAINLEYKLIAAEKGDKKSISHATSVSCTDTACLRFIFRDNSLELRKTLRTLVYNNEKRLSILENYNKFSYSYESIVENETIDTPYRSCFFKVENMELLKQNYLRSIN